MIDPWPESTLHRQFGLSGRVDASMRLGDFDLFGRLESEAFESDVSEDTFGGSELSSRRATGNMGRWGTRRWRATDGRWIIRHTGAMGHGDVGTGHRG